MPWVNIPNSVFEAGKPARALDMRNLRDNIAALAAGEVGAPRLQGRAVARDFNGGLDVVTVAAGSVVSAQGEGYKTGGTYLNSTNSGTDVLGAAYEIQAYTGTLRFNATIAGGSSPARSCVASLYRNGALIGSQSASTSTAVFVDSPVAPGDDIEWRFRSNVAGLVVTFTRGVVSADDPYVEQPAYRRFSEVFL